MNDGGTLYRWREDQRQYAPESVKHALVREESGIARDWWEPVCTLAEYLGVELRAPVRPAELRMVIENTEAQWRRDLLAHPRDASDRTIDVLLEASKAWLAHIEVQKCST